MRRKLIRWLTRMSSGRFIFSLLLICFSATTDATAQNFWQPTNGPFAGIVHALFITPTGNILAGTESGGVFYSGDVGETWPQAFGLPTNHKATAFTKNSATDDIFVAFHSDSVYQSSDDGKTWTSLMNYGLLAEAPFVSLAINSNEYLFAATYGQGVYRSTDGGKNWIQINNGLPNKAYCVVINDSDYVFASTFFEGGIHRSKDNGGSWVRANQGLIWTDDVKCLAISANGDIYAGTEYGVFRSTNNGDFWMEINQGFPTDTEGKPIAIVQSLGINSAGRVFAGTSSGAFRLNSGDSWEPVNTGLASNRIQSFAFDSTGYLFAGTNGGTVFRSTESTTGSAPECTTNFPINVGAFSATLKGTVNPKGLSTTVQFQYGTTTSYGIEVAATSSPVLGTNPVSVSADIDELSANTLYHYRVVGTNSAGTTYGADQTFTTASSGSAPTVTTDVAANVMSTSATLNGAVNPNSLSTNAIFQYGTTTSYGKEINATQNPISGASPVSVSAVLTGLSPGTLYHYRAVGTNSAGTRNGANQTFTTNSAPVVADTIRNQTLTLGGASFTRDLNVAPTVFTDPNGDALSYSASSSLQSVATAIISGSTLTVSPVNGGISTITVTAHDGRDGMVSTTFLVTINRPPVVANPIANQALTVDGASFTRDLKVSPSVFNDPDDSVEALTYSAGSNAPTIATVEVLGTVLTVAPVAVGSATITVSANDRRGGTVSTNFLVTINIPPYPSSLNVSTIITYPTRSKASEYLPTDYRIIGIPGASNQMVTTFLSLSSDRKGKDWQVYWDNGDPSSDPNKYLVSFDDSPTFQVAAGRAFWVLNKGPLQINKTVSSAPLNAAEEVAIPLRSGWNLITNPFDKAIAWSRIQSANGSLTGPICSYEGDGVNFSISSNFDPYVGYYFFKPSNLDTLKIPYRLLFGASPSANEVDPVVWRIGIVLSSNQLNDKTNFFGVSHFARRNLDPLDFRKPRAIANAPSVDFKRPQWDANYSTFASDIRPDFEDSESWEFDVRAIPRQPAQLAFTGLQRIPLHFAVYLIDEGRADSLNLRTDSLYHFMPAAELMKFKVVVGKKDSVQKQLNALSLPKEFALGPNYPNPFSANGPFGNPTTNIPVAIPRASEITLKIYNLLGEEVQTIYDGSIEAGRYWFSWDGRNKAGGSAASGVYVYRLTASKGVRLVGKMILMR